MIAVLSCSNRASRNTFVSTRNINLSTPKLSSEGSVPCIGHGIPSNRLSQSNSGFFFPLEAFLVTDFQEGTHEKNISKLKTRQGIKCITGTDSKHSLLGEIFKKGASIVFRNGY